MSYRLPSPWMQGEHLHSLYAANGAIPAYAAAANPAANRAHYVPVWFPASVTVTQIIVGFTTAAGNYDVGLYDSNFNLLEAKGSTACSNAAHTFTLTKPQRIRAGDLVHAALVMSSVSDSTFRAAPSGFSGVSSGYAIEALGATALPSTATPAIPTEPVYIPLFLFGFP